MDWVRFRTTKPCNERLFELFSYPLQAFFLTHLMLLLLLPIHIPSAREDTTAGRSCPANDAFSCLPFFLGVGGEVGALADAPGPASLLLAFICSLGNAHLYKALPGPLGWALGLRGLLADPMSLGWAGLHVLVGWSCWGSCRECFLSAAGMM